MIIFGFDASIYETLKEDYNDKYEYIFPEITFDKNLFNDSKLGELNLQSNYKVHNYDTNKYSNFFVNDLNWTSKDIYFQNGLKGSFLSKIKNINYEAKNIDFYKESTTNELYGAIGYLTELDLQKNNRGANHLLTPKFLVRYSPGQMRKEQSGSRLTPINAFSLNRLNSINNFETGLTGTIGFDYEYKSQQTKLDFSLAQIISEKKIKKCLLKPV